MRLSHYASTDANSLNCNDNKSWEIKFITEYQRLVSDFFKTPRLVWRVAEQSLLFADGLVYVTGRCAAVHQMALSNWVLFLGRFVADAGWHITAYPSGVCVTFPAGAPLRGEEGN